MSKAGRVKDVPMPNLAELPAVHEILAHPRLAALAAEADHALLVAEIQACLARHRALLAPAVVGLFAADLAFTTDIVDADVLFNTIIPKMDLFVNNFVSISSCFVRYYKLRG